VFAYNFKYYAHNNTINSIAFVFSLHIVKSLSRLKFVSVEVLVYLIVHIGGIAMNLCIRPISGVTYRIVK
jgi:hypothetical protein